MWTVVEFSDGLQIVPSTWIYYNNGMCSWPPFTNQNKINKVIRDNVEAEKTWPKHEVKRVFCNAGEVKSRLFG